MAVGFPGIVLAVITYAFIREPKRGLSEGIETKPSSSPFFDTFKEFLGLTPLSLIGSKNLLNKLFFNFIMGFILFLSCFTYINLLKIFFNGQLGELERT